MAAIEPTTDRASRPNVVVVGAGFGGLYAAKRLQKEAVNLTVIDRRNHHLFQPLLYQVATAMLSPADIAVPVRSVISKAHKPAARILLDEVTAVDPQANAVKLATGGSIPYDYLIMATGSQYNYFGREADWGKIAPGIKTLEDAVEIRRRVLLSFERAEQTDDKAEQDRLLTFILIGGGPTGVEMAGSLAELARSSLKQDFTKIDPRDARIILLEAGPRLLSSFTEKQSAYAKGVLVKMGVEVRLNSGVESIRNNGVVAGGEFIPARNVFWAAGVKATLVSEGLKLHTARNGAAIVEKDFSLATYPNIFVVGDASAYTTEDGKTLPALAPVAKQEGAYVGEVVARKVRGEAPPAPFRYFDWGTMATVGRSAAIGQFGRFSIQGFFAWLFWCAVHISYLVGFRNRIVVLINWLWAFVTYAKGARLITGSTSLPSDPGHADDEPRTPVI